VIAEFERLYVRPTPGVALIVGSKVYAGREDRRKRFNHAVGIDLEPGEGVDIVADLERIPEVQIGRYSHIECISVLEHVRRPWLMARTLEGLLKPGGSIFISAPFVWTPHRYPADYYRFSPDGIKALFEQIEWKHAAIGNQTLGDGLKIRRIIHKGHPYIPRTESFAFGVKP
jgi:hypothetical protein